MTFGARLLFYGTSFLSAFLLFGVQPLVVKRLLPFFGGGHGVWTVSMLFFTTVLLAGYTYAWRLCKLPARAERPIHGTVFVASLISVLSVFFFSENGIAEFVIGEQNPISAILGVLLLAIGIPYFALSTTSTLLQSWIASFQKSTHFILYSVSNAGSLSAIILYPFLFEPRFDLNLQEKVWAALFVLYAAAMFVCFRLHLKNKTQQPLPFTEPSARTPARRMFFWVMLSALGSSLLIAGTSQMTQEIAPIPLLWLLPLALYLLTFIFCFSGKKLYWPPLFAILGIAGSVVSIAVWTTGSVLPMGVNILVLSVTLFCLLMICHGELYARRPPLEKAGLFYLLIALGGSLGSLAIAVIAPSIFNAYWEFPLLVFAGIALAVRVMWLSGPRLFSKNQRRLLILSGFLLFIATVGTAIENATIDVIAMNRNFYGAVTVSKVRTGSHGNLILLKNGTIVHGSQLTAKPTEPISYYTRGSGVSIALEHVTTSMAKNSAKVGIVGLGTGSLSAYCREQDFYTYYEINRQVVDIAKRHFTFLGQCKNTEIILGDARLSIKEHIEADRQKYDILVIDAFSSDAIPVHLLTKEALDMYFDALQKNGIVAVHTSNRHLDLVPVVIEYAAKHGLYARVVYHNPEPLGTYSSQWVLLSYNLFPNAKDPVLLQQGLERSAPLWTDEKTSLLPLIRW